MLSPAQRQSVADLWFSTMFVRFQRDNLSTFDTPLTEAAERWRQKLLGSTGQLTFEYILAEISSFMALSPKTEAQDYFDF